MSFDIETVSNDERDLYEIWTCKKCGRSYQTGIGGDVACCMCEFEEEG